MKTPTRWFVLTASLGGTVACGTEISEPCSTLTPGIFASSVAPNPNNVLSAIVSAQAPDADSVAVGFGPAAADLDSLTPAVLPAGDQVSAPVLGLLPQQDYQLRVVAYRGGCLELGPLLSFTTGPLPADLPSYTAGGPAPPPGLVVFSAGPYGLAIDNTGRVVWYRRFSAGAGLNFQPQPNGRYVAVPPPSDPFFAGQAVEVDPLGNLTRSFGCAGGLRIRFHDMLLEADGSAWLMCDEVRTMDLSNLGGSAQAQVTGTQVQHLSPAGTLLFHWSPFDHFEITDLDPADRTGTNVNWTHGNAIDLDLEGNLLVSFRSLSEVTKIDTRTGVVLWRMGGLRNQFSFVNTTSPAFARQHGLRALSNHSFVLLDNLGDPALSRPEIYSYETPPPGAPGQPVASLIKNYLPGGPVVALLGGTTQPFPDGRTLVAYGNGGKVEEYGANGQVVWRIEGNSGYVFRAHRIKSLYRPGVGSPR